MHPKQKGKYFEKRVQELLINLFPEFDKLLVRRTIGSGVYKTALSVADINLLPEYPLIVEAKNQKIVNKLFKYKQTSTFLKEFHRWENQLRADMEYLLQFAEQINNSFKALNRPFTIEKDLVGLLVFTDTSSRLYYWVHIIAVNQNSSFAKHITKTIESSAQLIVTLKTASINFYGLQVK